MMGFLLDLRYAMRLLAKSPKFTILTSFILMGGLALSLVTFNFINTLAFKSLDTPEGESILTVSIDGQYPSSRIQTTDINKLQAQLFDQLYSEYSFYHRNEVRLTIQGVGRNMGSQKVSSNFFGFTRFQPIMGRNFTPADEQPSSNNVAAISYRLWQSLFARDEQIIGKTVSIDGQPVEIVAVMPEHYTFPANADLWLPLDVEIINQSSPTVPWIDIMARLREGVSTEQANTTLTENLTAITLGTLSTSEKEDFEGVQASHFSLPKKSMGTEGSVLLIGLQGVALAILLMACINTGNLIFARSIERQKETAIRSALGATQKRLIRQLVCEGGLLTLIGGFFAILLSGWLLNLIDQFMRTLTGDRLPFWWHWRLDSTTLIVAVLFIVLTFVFACLIPAIKASRMDINTVLRDGTRGALSKSSGRISNILVTVQITLIAILMLLGSVAGTLIFSVVDDMAQQDNLNRYQASLRFDEAHFVEPDHKAELIKNVLLKLRSQKNIEDAGLLTEVGPNNTRVGGQDSQMRVDIYSSAGNLGFFGIDIIKGRDLDSSDNGQSSRAALVSQSYSARHWPGQDSIGRTIDIETQGQYIPHTVVGVVSNKGRNSQGLFADKARYDEIYTSYYQRPLEDADLVIKTTQQAEQGEEDFYRVMLQLNARDLFGFLKNKKLDNDLISEMMVTGTQVFIYSGIFSLFLALMGVYGVSASAVAMRSHEIGIRRALGAKDGAVIRLFLKRNMTPLITGLSIGLVVYSAACFIFSKLILGQVEVTFYIAIALVTSLMLSFMLCLAAYFPTRRAIEKEPAETLRAD